MPAEAHALPGLVLTWTHPRAAWFLRLNANDGSDIVHFEVESFTESGILCLRAVARDLSLVAR